VIEPGCHRIKRVEDLMRRVIETVRDLIDVLKPDPRLFQTVRDRLDREFTGVLSPAEALLRGGGHNLAVDNQRGGGIMPLGEPVFALFQTRPVTPLKWNRTVQSANTEYVHWRLPQLCFHFAVRSWTGLLLRKIPQGPHRPSRYCARSDFR